MAESAESMTSYQYAGNNPVMYNDPLGNIKKAPQDDPMSYSLPRGGAGYLSAIDGGGYDTDNYAYQDMVNPLGVFGGNGGGGNGGGGGLTGAQWLFISVMATHGSITQSYSIAIDGVFRPITDLSAFSLAIAYANQFDMWGTNGAASNVVDAVVAYDNDPNRKGPGLTTAGKIWNDKPIDLSPSPYVPGQIDLPVVIINDKKDDRDWFEGGGTIFIAVR